MKDPHLISVDELRAAGALDVPPVWRKSLGGERALPLFPDEDVLPKGERSPSCELEEDESAPESDASADGLP